LLVGEEFQIAWIRGSGFLYQLCLIFEETSDIQYKEWMLKGEGETTIPTHFQLFDTARYNRSGGKYNTSTGEALL